jgi:hypothetical protein
MFVEGHRDEDTFHIAHLIANGGGTKDEARQTLKAVAEARGFGEDIDIEAKVRSAFNREDEKNATLVEAVDVWLEDAVGEFTISELRRDLDVKSRLIYKKLSKTLCRRVDQGLLERIGKKNGVFRKVDPACVCENWADCDENYIPLWLPLGLGDVFGAQPGNIIVYAGSKDSGKTLNLMATAKMNQQNYKVRYLNSEMSNQEFKKRVRDFNQPIEEWKDIEMIRRSSDFTDVLLTGEGHLNVIDYLEAPTDLWKIGSMIQAIHHKLDGALCVIGLQKNVGSTLGRGGSFSMEKARLYIALDFSKAQIVSCKNYRMDSPVIKGNPRGWQCEWALDNGWPYVKHDGNLRGWTYLPATTN